MLQGPEEVEVHAVGGIQPEPVDVETVHPHAHGPQQVIPDLGVFQVELHQLIVAAPGLVPEGVPHGGAPAEVQVLEPAAVGGGLALLLHIAEGPEATAHVVKDAVQHHPDAILVEGVTQGGEGVHVSQAAVDLVVVGGVVAVLHRLAHRPQIEGVHAQLLEVGNPLPQLFQPLNRFPAGVVLGTAAEAQGIDMVKDGAVDPVLHVSFAPIFARNGPVRPVEPAHTVYHREPDLAR